MRTKFISTKQLRTEFPAIRQDLAGGVEFVLIHRSQPIANIYPVSEKGKTTIKSIREIAGGSRFSEKLGRALTPEFINELAESRYEGIS